MENNIYSWIKKYGSVLVYLNQFVLESLDRLGSPLNPFKSNIEFMQQYEAYFMVRNISIKIHEKFQEQFFVHSKDKNFLGDYTTLVDALKELQLLILGHIKQRTQITEKTEGSVLPRFIRMCRRYQLTDGEMLGLAFVVTCQSSMIFGLHELELKSSIKELGAYSGLDSSLVLNFVNPSKLIMKQGILEIDSTYNEIWGDSVIKMTPGVLQALLGSEISAEDFLKIVNRILNVCKTFMIKTSPSTLGSGVFE
jgi:hypothetical protein